MALPMVYGGNTTRILEFYQKLVTHVQLLEKLGKCNTNKEYVKYMLDTLPYV